MHPTFDQQFAMSIAKNCSHNCSQEHTRNLLFLALNLSEITVNSHAKEMFFRSELFSALKNNNPQQCEDILNKATSENITTDLNKSDNNLPTYLQFACEAGLNNVAKFLLDHGARPDVTSIAKPVKPIILACEASNGELIQLLIEYGANISDACSDTQETVLHVIAKRLLTEPEKFFDSLKIILKYQNDNFNINAQDINGDTALNLAAITGYEEAILLLLHNGADIRIANNEGISPLYSIHPSIFKTFFDECITSNQQRPTARLLTIIGSGRSLLYWLPLKVKSI
ncbi:hypothetical protein QYM36_015305 [Artemia franciscana]|uniref:Ankyrin repeat protein n=1 Tax=Artemia franciscana TaxID=6661 RepID=A0AA88L4F6_ARTSF|nr:hypothetical protein QYM36_015305 [Artemia franciscana]